MDWVAEVGDAVRCAELGREDEAAVSRVYLLDDEKEQGPTDTKTGGGGGGGGAGGGGGVGGRGGGGRGAGTKGKEGKGGSSPPSFTVGYFPRSSCDISGAVSLLCRAATGADGDAAMVNVLLDTLADPSYVATSGPLGRRSGSARDLR